MALSCAQAISLAFQARGVGKRKTDPDSPDEDYAVKTFVGDRRSCVRGRGEEIEDRFSRNIWTRRNSGVSLFQITRRNQGGESTDTTTRSRRRHTWSSADRGGFKLETRLVVELGAGRVVRVDSARGRGFRGRAGRARGDRGSGGRKPDGGDGVRGPRPLAPLGRHAFRVLIDRPEGL